MAPCQVQRKLVYRRRQLFIRTQVSGRPLRDQAHRELMYRALQFHKRSQLFIRTHNETLSVAMQLAT